MQKITPFNLVEMKAQEQKLKLLLFEKKENRICTPKKETVENILNYSKVLSVRKSQYLDFIEIVLN